MPSPCCPALDVWALSPPNPLLKGDFSSLELQQGSTKRWEPFLQKEPREELELLAAVNSWKQPKGESPDEQDRLQSSLVKLCRKEAGLLVFYSQDFNGA